MPAGWYLVGNPPGEYDISVTTAAGYVGPGVRIRSTPDGDSPFGGVGQTISAHNYLGSRIRLSGYLRSVEVAGWAGLWLRVDGERGGPALGFDNMEDRPVRASQGWSEHDIVLAVPDNATRIVFGVLLSGEGELWADELRLEIVSDDIPVTGSALPREPVNLSF